MYKDMRRTYLIIIYSAWSFNCVLSVNDEAEGRVNCHMTLIMSRVYTYIYIPI